jgi:hypothetical protein
MVLPSAASVPLNRCEKSGGFSMPFVLATSFWNNFWPGVIAGVVSGTLTSVVAGVVFYRRQIGWEKQERKAVARRDLDQLLAGLRRAWARRTFAYPDCTKASRTLPTHYGEAARLIDGQPLHQWRELLPAESSLLDACAHYRGCYDTFIRAAGAFDREIDNIIGPDESGLSNPGERVHAFLVAEVVIDPKRDDRWLLVMSGAPADMDEGLLRADANTVNIDMRYAQTKAPFVSARAAIEEAASTLSGSLGIHD